MGKDEISFLHNQKVKSRKSSAKVRLYKTYHEVKALMLGADGVFSVALFQNKNDRNEKVLGILCKHHDNAKTMRKLKLRNNQKKMMRVVSYILNPKCQMRTHLWLQTRNSWLLVIFLSWLVALHFHLELIVHSYLPSFWVMVEKELMEQVIHFLQQFKQKTSVRNSFITIKSIYINIYIYIYIFLTF